MNVEWMIVFIASFLTALIVSAMCSIAESVLLSLTTGQVVAIGKKNPKIGAIWETFKKDVNVPIASILTVNTIAHTVGASLAGAAFAKLFGETWIWVFSAVFTFLMLQYTEILPKSIGVRYRQSLAFWIARPLVFFIAATSPIVKFLNTLNKPFESGKLPDEVTAVQEIMFLTSLAKSRSQLDAEQEKVILSALKMSTTEVYKLTVPMKEVSILSEDTSPAEAFEAAQNDSHTRFPVYYGNRKDLIIGYVNFKEFAFNRTDLSENSWGLVEQSGNLSKYVRKITRVDKNDKVSDVLNVLVKNHEHIALVVDSEQNVNLGIITLEDLVEQLVGEIEDEFDYLPETLQKYSDMIRVGGGSLLEKVVECAKEIFPQTSETFVREITQLFEKEHNRQLRFNDWIESKLDGVVTRNSRVDCGGLSFWVKRARRGKVFDVTIFSKSDDELLHPRTDKN